MHPRPVPIGRGRAVQKVFRDAFPRAPAGALRSAGAARTARTAGPARTAGTARVTGPPAPTTAPAARGDAAAVRRRRAARPRTAPDPLALRGVRNLLVYGLGRLVLPFVGIKVIDLVVSTLPGLG
ncbi:hypothetical protein [Streptomyces sp. NPDC085466]|uniref:hypothetical protein n=1 Tax=Streptomyces sp. NPDC085466 TaxID=3365725 RepID=UPI0037D2AE20